MKTFKTSDGFVLKFDSVSNTWSDGDLVFQSNENGIPIDHDGEVLESASDNADEALENIHNFLYGAQNG